ncbi:hypothetical protein [Maridesulfovibrio salexigens]|uniref:Uncharacterized protein n=1 Tax=Maridesulfovibrio salexigens (strain ATCC 14822 / DSM 2638 / NCIMB 8403 / VKM B-1763) TaxID=526222 RepID=C6BRP8_MARSD|nr:hypothetical protein [Maridesulfovibrio salexigens]ACS79488.1 hypothetical protein Desal_1426 [Maridesulfovibrio salexigens DSM 2638]
MASVVGNSGVVNLDAVFKKLIPEIVKKHNDLELEMDSLIKECAVNINSLNLGSRKVRVFKDKLQTGKYLEKLKEKCLDNSFEWSEIFEEVQGYLSESQRNLQRFMLVARERELDQKYYSESFTTVHDYIAAVRKADKKVNINDVLDQLNFNESKESVRRDSARRAAYKVALRTVNKNSFDPSEINDLEVLIDAAEVGFDYKKIVDSYLKVPDDKKSEHVDKALLKSSSRKLNAVSIEPIHSILARLKSEMDGIKKRSSELSVLDISILKNVVKCASSIIN